MSTEGLADALAPLYALADEWEAECVARSMGLGKHNHRDWPKVNQLRAVLARLGTAEGTVAGDPKRDEFSAERREQIIEALSWHEDLDSGRWGRDRAEDVLSAHEKEWCGRFDADPRDARPAPGSGTAEGTEG